MVGLLVLAPPARAAVFGPEPSRSPNADDITTAYWVMLAIAVAIVAAVNVALIGAVARFRATRGRPAERVRGAGRVQARAAIPLAVLAAGIFVAGVVFTVRARDVAPGGEGGLSASTSRTAQLGLDLPEADGEPLRILVSGQQWLWRYEYPDGTFSYYELVVPVDTPVVLKLDSTDVLHRWWVPGLGGKFDATPARLNDTWFRAEEEGVFDGQSAAFSGPAYSTMRARVRAVSVPEYQDWLEQQKDDIQKAQAAVQKRVEELGPGAVPGAAAGGTQ